jgi:hypothetical protein
MDPDSDSIWLRIRICRPWMWIRQNVSVPSISGSGSTKREGRARKKTTSAWSIVIIQPLLPLPKSQSQRTLKARWLLIMRLIVAFAQMPHTVIGIFLAKTKKQLLFTKIFRRRKAIAPMPIWDLERQTELVKHVCSLFFSNFLEFEKRGLIKLLLSFVYRTDLHMVKTQSAFQPHDSTIFPVYNPLPGPWFAIAYLSPFEEKITQQGDPCSWLSVRALNPDALNSDALNPDPDPIRIRIRIHSTAFCAV